ncbi:TolC family protein, partial [Candidatus Fermentibacterales bacterium]|nr:TolC family protein [Candidatus Fermentibacterales bacterium]
MTCCLLSALLLTSLPAVEEAAPALEVFPAWESDGEVERVMLDLSGWVSVALGSSPDLEAAAADVEAARASRGSARSLLLPTLSLSASAGRTWSTSVGATGDPVDLGTGSYSASLTLTQDILNSGGSDWLSLSAQEQALDASEEDYRAARLALELEVLEAFYDVVEAGELERSAERALERSARQLERVEALYGMGGATTLEYLQASVQESSDRLRVSQRSQALRTAYYELYDACGLIPRGATMYLVDLRAVLEPLSLETLRGMDLDPGSSPGLAASRHRLRQAELSWRAQRRSYWPSLSVSGSYSWSDDELGLDGWSDEDRWNVMLSLRWTIFDGWLRESRIGSSRAGYLRSAASLESLESSLVAGIAGLRESLAGSIESYDLAVQSSDLALQAYDLAVRSYELGAASLIEIL